MDKWSRVQATLRREAVDRVPLSLWRHFHERDRTPQVLAEATLTLAGEYDLDLIKLTPCGLYAAEDWAKGHIECPATIHDPPYLRTPAVTDPAGWRRLPTLEPTSGALGRELEAIRLVAAGLATRTPFLMTIFSPLTLAYKLAGDVVVEHLRQHPTALHAGLEIMGETMARFARAALEAGADGLFFATQLASHHWLAPAEYHEFGERYDLGVLEAAAEQSTITVLHLHGRDVFFDLVNRYPVHAVSWHDRETDPSLIEARGRTDRAFVAGLDRELLDSGPLAAIRAQVGETLIRTGGCEEGGREGLGLILAPSCVIPTTAPAAHLWAVRDTISAR
jgi:uroporphyrinogen decarboxylase